MLATASCDCSVKIWLKEDEVENFREVLCLEGHSNWVRDVSWSNQAGNNYEILVSCSEVRIFLLAPCFQDQTAILWKVQKTTERDFSASQLKVLQYEGPVWRVCWSLSNNLLAVSASSSKSDNTIYVYQVSFALLLNCCPRNRTKGTGSRSRSLMRASALLTCESASTSQ